MNKLYSTMLLFYCSIQDISENSDPFDLMESRLKQSLSLLSTVINIIYCNNNISTKMKQYLNKFKNIKNFSGNKLPPNSEEFWNIEEFTILMLMLLTVKRKRYSSMKKTVNRYVETTTAPSEKVINANREWLLEAYNYLGRLKYYRWSNKINRDLLVTLFNGDLDTILSEIKEIDLTIKRSGVLHGEMDSVIGQILAKCAYPELINNKKKGYSDRLIEEIANVMAALETVEGVIPQEVAINESIKKLVKLREDIECSYDVSKYYTDTYWVDVLKESNNDQNISLIIAKLKDQFATELDTISKVTL